MKSILTIISILSAAISVCTADTPATPEREEQADKGANPVVQEQDESPDEEQLPQPPPTLAKITTLDKADEQGIVWGDTQNGLAIGISKLETSLKSPTRPMITIYLENRGENTIERDSLRRASFHLKLNGKNAGNPGPVIPLRLNEQLDPGERHGPVELTTDEFRIIQSPLTGLVVNQNRPGPELPEGIHTLQLDYLLARVRDTPLVIASQSVRVEVSFSPYPVDDAVAMIREGLQDEALQVRRTSAVMAGQLKLHDCRKDLIQACKDKDLFLRRYAATSLGELKDPAAIAPLKELLRDDQMMIRLEAVRSLIDLGVPLQNHWIEPIIKSKRSLEFRGAVALARDKLGKKAVPLLIRCLDFEDSSLSNYFNFYLVQQIGACGGPTYTYHYNRRVKGTPEQIQTNQRALLELKALVISDL